ncbi:MAG: plastoquinol--plastocyanin reductase [Chlorobi bacterium]|nr:plastoquinol--plastocyanin reductase [Chlorobiota bacterium]
MKNSYEGGDLLPRREFLEKIFTASIIAVAAPMALLGKSVPVLSGKQGMLSGLYTLTLDQYPVLKNIGGSVKLVVAGKEIRVTRASNTKITALSPICTHQGCTINDFNASLMRFECPCHGSRYDAEGKVLRGPAPLPLKSYTLTFDGTNVIQVEVPELQSGVDDVADQNTFLESFRNLNGTAVIEYGVGTATRVLLTLHTISGVEVRRLVDAHVEAGRHRYELSLSGLSSGAYIYRMETSDGFVASHKLMIAK